MVDEIKTGWNQRIDELVNKEMIKPEQVDGLKKMIDSSDKENFAIVKEIVKIKLEDRLAEGLNADQTVAFNDIIEFLRDGTEDAFILKGYAGTGKTFLVKRIIEYITAIYPKRSIAITAPTNKAVRVLQADAPFVDGESTILDNVFTVGKVKYSTIHKLLGLKEQVTDSGNQLFKPDPKDKSELSKFKYLIVDEVSMLDDALCVEILKQNVGIKVIFMGDPAQIPPVNRMDCIPFRDTSKYNFKRAELNEIMRQTGEHPVVDASFILRNNLDKKQPIPTLNTDLTEDDKGIVYLNSETDRKTVKPLLEKLFNCEEFSADADHAKVIAWRNKTVDYINTIIREILYGKTADMYMVGEKIIARSSIFKPNDNKSRWGAKWVVKISTSEEMEILDVKLIKKKFAEGSYKLYAQMYQCEIKIYDPIDKVYKLDTIFIMHESSAEDYQALIKKVKNMAIRARDKSAWITYYNIIKWSADVSYNYAITAHKAQGSTYKNVVLMEEDLDHNPNVVERNRIKYTAYSRPTDKLFILRKNYV